MQLIMIGQFSSSELEIKCGVEGFKMSFFVSDSALSDFPITQ